MFTWTNIDNGESALSVRNKINTLGKNSSDYSKQFDETVESTNTTLQSMQSEIDDLKQGAASKTNNIVMQNVSVPVSAWVADSTYTTYKYKADISTGSYVAGNYVPIVCFEKAEQESGNFAGSDSSGNKVTIYAISVPSNAINVQVLLIGTQLS